ncbi:membrane protein [gut metagenome]|uniref:Membrane protein n=1 Tax=gut metagenome TaxID=749906 RepID=J9FR20_9ZZZZ
MHFQIFNSQGIKISFGSFPLFYRTSVSIILSCRLFLAVIGIPVFSVLVFEASDFVGSRLFKRFFHHFYFLDFREFIDLFVDIVKDCLLAGFQIFKELVLALLIPVYYIIIKLDQCHQPSVPFKYNRLVDIIHIVDDLLNLLRIDIFSRRTQDHITQPSFYVITAFLVNNCKVIGPEPSVFSEY